MISTMSSSTYKVFFSASTNYPVLAFAKLGYVRMQSFCPSKNPIHHSRLKYYTISSMEDIFSKLEFWISTEIKNNGSDIIKYNHALDFTQPISTEWKKYKDDIIRIHNNKLLVACSLVCSVYDTNFDTACAGLTWLRLLCHFLLVCKESYLFPRVFMVSYNTSNDNYWFEMKSDWGVKKSYMYKQGSRYMEADSLRNESGPNDALIVPQ